MAQLKVFTLADYLRVVQHFLCFTMVCFHDSVLICDDTLQSKEDFMQAKQTLCFSTNRN